MKQLKTKASFPLILSGILTFVGVLKGVFVFGWVCFLPLFIATFQQSARQAFRSGSIFGLSLAVVSFYWMIPGAERFTGNSVLYGIAAFLISTVFLALWSGLVLSLIGFLRHQNDSVISFLSNAAMVAAIFCVAEFLLSLISQGMPWFDFHAGNAIADNLWAIQPAAFSGVYGLTFIVVFVNYISAVIIVKKRWKYAYLPFVFLLGYLFGGYLLLEWFNAQLKPGKSFTTNILCENILPDIKWNDENGNQLVEQLLDLNKKSLLDKADMNLWSESTVPWTYRADDDFVKEILRSTKPAGVTTVMGINSDHAENEVYNSVYCISPEGTVIGRYDKHYLLSFIEQPVGAAIIPFLSSVGFIIKPGEKYDVPVQTPFGKAGIIVCNEATVPAAASGMANEGAQFLFNLSNDGWFNDTYITDLHFINARIRAVETRKDICINSNNGFSGLVKATGVVAVKERNTESFVKKVGVEPNNEKTFFMSQPHGFLYACGLLLVMFTVLKFRRKGV
ncbi:MAG TPA: apolipoprotein N-acyltransferase [Panacibacter sp.]|nr:apolipoprotein N-acyltransferase [Panacibacter sp.]HNP45338.1 apolipoprotein N-acyltransferase [Panacibacter sp.]